MKLFQIQFSFSFNSEHEKSFTDLKQALASNPYYHSKFDETFLLILDASAFTLSAILNTPLWNENFWSRIVCSFKYFGHFSVEGS